MFCKRLKNHKKFFEIFDTPHINILMRNIARIVYFEPLGAIYDLNYQMVFSNSTIDKYYCYQLANIFGKSIFELYSYETYTQIQAVFERVFFTKQPVLKIPFKVEGFNEFTDFNRRCIYGKRSAYPIFDDDWNVIYFKVVFEIISKTEYEQLEKPMFLYVD